MNSLRLYFLNWHTFWSFILLLSLLWSLQVAGVFQGDLINTGGITLVLRFLAAATSPEISPEFLRLTLNATLTTLAFATCGTFLSLLIGMIGGLFSSQVWWHCLFPNNSSAPWLLVRGILAIPRSIHEAIWGLFFVNIFGLDPLVAIGAIALPFGAITAKVFAEILDETSPQALQSLLGSGVAPLPAFLYSLIPQAFLNLLSYAFYRFECSIRSAAVLGIIGAGGLGYEILLSLQALNYQQMWTFLIALILLTGSVDLWSSLLRRSLDAPTRLDLHFLSFKKTQTSYFRERKSYLTIFSILGTVSLIIFSFWYIKADFSQLCSPRTINNLITIVTDAFPPNFSQFSSLWKLAQQTLAMSVLAIVIAGAGGILLSFTAANNLFLPGGVFNPVKSNKLLPLFLLITTRFILLLTRAVPEPIWALIFLFGFFPGILPGGIALGLHNLGILGRLMAEVIENLDQRPLKSLSALGATSGQVFLYGILPLTLPRFLAYILYRWEVCIRATVIVGLVGAGGLGRLLTEQLSNFDYPSVVTILIVFIILTFVVDLVSASARQTLR
ncbi:MAG: ABC transporter permease subunit [Spirulinaceae cyanobacterium]